MLNRARNVARFLLLVAPLALASRVSADEPMRTWTDSTGRYRVEAKLTGREGENVRLVRPDGAEIEMPFAKLSEADRAYVETYDAGNPFLAGAKPKPMTAAPTSAAPTTSPPQVASIGPIDWSTAPQIDLLPLGTSLAELPAVANAPNRIDARTIGLPSSGDFFDRVRGLVADAATGKALLTSGSGRPGQTKTRLTPIDLGQAKSGLIVEADGEFSILAYDGASERAISLAISRDDNARPLQVWSLKDRAVRPIAVTAPLRFDRSMGRVSAWATFLSGDRFATLSSERFAVWSIASGAPLATLPLDGESVVAALRPDGRVVAIVDAGGVTFVDTTDLKAVGRIDTELGHVEAAAFNEAGDRLAVKRRGRRATVWNLADGTATNVDAVSPFEGAFFFADDERLYDRGRFVDLASGTAVLEIVNAPDAAVACGGTVWALADGTRNTRSLVALPPIPEDLDERIAEREAEPIEWSLPAGSSIRIDASAISVGAPRTDVEKALTQAIGAAGHRVDDGGEFTLVAKTRQEEPEKYEYNLVERSSMVPPHIPRPIGFGDRIVERRQFTISEVVYTLELRRGDDVVWKATHSKLPQGVKGMGMFRLGIGANVDLKEGQTIDDYVRDLEKADYARFADMKVPTSERKPGAWQQPVLGAKRLTTGGLQ